MQHLAPLLMTGPQKGSAGSDLVLENHHLGGGFRKDSHFDKYFSDGLVETTNQIMSLQGGMSSLAGKNFEVFFNLWIQSILTFKRQF